MAGTCTTAAKGNSIGLGLAPQLASTSLLYPSKLKVLKKGVCLNIYSWFISDLSLSVRLKTVRQAAFPSLHPGVADTTHTTVNNKCCVNSTIAYWSTFAHMQVIRAVENIRVRYCSRRSIPHTYVETNRIQNFNWYPTFKINVNCPRYAKFFTLKFILCIYIWNIV